ncbi:tetratricopeptide repeat protein [Bacteroidota bacterium]
MKKIIFPILIVLSVTLYGQTDKEKAFDLGMRAIEEMENGHIDAAIKLLEQSKKLDPENISYPYEIAYAKFLNKEYNEAIKILKGIKKHPQANDLVYQMLGNCHDMIKKPKKAIAIYEEGLKLFPNSGKLYLERGNMEFMSENYNSALEYYEKGLEVDPDFPSNYYWSAFIFLNSSEEVWGMIYGEIFLNLEPDTKRTSEISKLIYDTYKNQIQFTSDSSYSVSFCQNATIDIGEISDVKNIKLPYGLSIYEPTLMLSMVNENTIEISSLNRIRTNFLKLYFDKGFDKTYPNILFDFQKQVSDAGHIEAYNYWILMNGEPDAFKEWKDSNNEKWEQFVAWFKDNRLQIDDSNKFFRTQY